MASEYTPFTVIVGGQISSRECAELPWHREIDLEFSDGNQTRQSARTVTVPLVTVTPLTVCEPTNTFAGEVVKPVATAESRLQA